MFVSLICHLTLPSNIALYPPVYCGNVPTTTTAPPVSNYVNQNPSDWVSNSPTYVKKISGAACDITTVTGSITSPNQCCQECAALNLPELSHITYDTSKDLCKCQKPYMENCLTTATDSSTKTKFCFDGTGKTRRKYLLSVFQNCCLVSLQRRLAA